MEGDDRFEVLIPEQRLQQRVRELGRQIAADYAGRDLVVVGILKGAVVFLADLVRNIDLPLSLDFLGLSSYGDATTSSGVVRITQDLSKPVVGRDVLIVEDIVDTGLTLGFLLDSFQARQPRSVKVCALLSKPLTPEGGTPVDYVGFFIDDRFVVGYGLDFEQRYRNLPYIAWLKTPQPA